MARKPHRLAILSHQELHRLASVLPFCFGETRGNTQVFKIAPSPSTWCKVLQLQRGRRPPLVTLRPSLGFD
jgi:hypothetical protein